MRLLAQAAQCNENRDAIISEEVFEMMNKLRAFRHIERNVYRHMLREDAVNENFERMKIVFPDFASEASNFINNYGRESDSVPRP